MNITELEITKLFGEVDVRIPIFDNRIIIVGYNGLGKSTILNIFYYFVSQQWVKLTKQDFHSVAIRVGDGGKVLRVERSEIEYFLEWRTRKRKISHRFRVPASLELDLFAFLTAEAEKEGSSYKNHPSEVIQKVKNKFNIPLHLAEDFYRYFRLSVQDELPLQDKGNIVSEVDEFISSNLKGRILYLPTYRRIERDVKEVFPEIEDELQRKLLRLRENTKSQTYIELVQFGMEDVAHKIKDRLDNIRGYALSQVNNLTAKYLRDVIRNEASQYRQIESGYIDDQEINSVFAKIDNSIISVEDRGKLVDVVKKINSHVDLEENEKYVAHYVAYLLDIGKNISQLEAPILKFVEICNSYLYGKFFEFDTIGYKLLVKRSSGRSVELEELSSGEKQIVSLFSHLLLDGERANYIFIDEPELSLSVDWQQRFLSDISRLDTCKLIAAVTHSPFIFENELDRHAVDLLERTSAAS